MTIWSTPSRRPPRSRSFFTDQGMLSANPKLGRINGQALDPHVTRLIIQYECRHRVIRSLGSRGNPRLILVSTPVRVNLPDTEEEGTMTQLWVNHS